MNTNFQCFIYNKIPLLPTIFKMDMLLLLNFFCCMICVKGLTFNEALITARCFTQCNNKTCLKSCENQHLYSTPEISRLNISANANVMLHCKDENLISIKHNPGIYIIEQSTEIRFQEEIKVTNGKFTLFSNLTAGTKYQYRLYRVTAEGMTQPEMSSWFTTNEENYRPKEVKNISLEHIQVDDTDIHHLTAEVVFEPAEDLCCYYNLLIWSELSLLQLTLKAPLEFRVRVSSLEYNQNNTVYIISRNKNGFVESKNVSYTFRTPSCLEMLKNLNDCAPPEVEGLTVKYFHGNSGSNNITVSWNKPELIPDNYTLQLESPNYIEGQLFVPGNLTEAVFPNVEAGTEYQVSIIAESPGGISEKVSATAVVENNLGIYMMLTESSGDEIKTKLLPDTKRWNEGYNEMFIVLSTLTIAMTLVGMIIYTYCRYRSHRYNATYKYFEAVTLKDSEFEGMKSSSKSKIETQPKDKFEIREEELELKQILGSGACGVVRLASLRVQRGHVIDVAVKMLKDNASLEDINNFKQEISMMKSAGKHPNIVSMIGVCTLENKTLLVVEYCCKGDLQTYLKSIWEATITIKSEGPARHKNFIHGSTVGLQEYSSMWSSRDKNIFLNIVENRLYDIQNDMINDPKEIEIELLNYARQIVIGMEFLSSNRIVHRDLAARNILVCKNRTVKISDFGLSRDIYQENVYKKQGNGKLPVKWMAIEALTHQMYTTHSDVWSFGILLWEIVTLGSNPYPGTPTNKVLQLLKSGYRMERPQNCGIQLYKMMRSCWKTNPKCRPTFTELKVQLDYLLSTVTNKKYLNMSDLRDYGHEENIEQEENLDSFDDVK